MTRRIVLAAAAALLVTGCGSDGPEPGDIFVELTGTAPARALLIRAVGPGAATITAGAPAGAANLRVVSAHVGGDTLRIAVIAPAGSTINPGAIARIAVSDVGAAASWSAVVQEAAGPTYALLNAGSFAVAVVR